MNERTETYVSDLISRQAAIDALMARDKRLRNLNWYDKPFAEGECRGIDEALEIVSNLPPAQSEQTKMIKEIRERINSGNRGSADYFIVDQIEGIINKYE